MKVSVNWLREFVDIDLSVDELVQKIGSQLGAVEEVIDLSPKYKGIIIAKVVTCEKHPNADKLSLCMVDDGGKAKGVKRDKSGLVQVVCGAPNVKAGMLAAWLPPGTTVPSSFDEEPFALEARELRGQLSNGMLASAHELALSEDHSGIVELEEGKPGDDFAKSFGLDDYVIDIENKMFTHRPDCFGILGVAREVAGILGKSFSSPAVYREPKLAGKKDKVSPEFKIKNEISDLVPRFTAQIYENVKVGPSPAWLQAKLARAGLNSINNVVDITNYFMVLTGQPMHAYDYDKLPAKSLETRLSKKGEKLDLIGGKDIKFDEEPAILITSGGKPVGVGGIKGGSSSEIDENTKTIVLECANFDMYSVRRTSMHYGLFTDAVTRFSKGQSPFQCDRVLAWASGELVHTAGATPSGNIFDEGKKLRPTLPVHVRTDFINERLGSDMTSAAMAKMLKNVEFEVKVNGPTLVVTPPFWRTDIEIGEDVVEEVGRLYGYDNLPFELPARSIQPAERNQLLDLKSKVRDVLSRAGANEVLTYSFIHGDLIENSTQDIKKAFKLSNAISPDIQYYRLSLTPSLLEKVHPNIKEGYGEFALFEIGKTHNKKHIDETSKLPKETEKIALVYAAKKSQNQGASYYQAQAYLAEILDKLNISFRLESIKSADYETAKPFELERSAHIVDASSGLVLGILGEYKASVRGSLKLPSYCAGFELSTLKILESVRAKTYLPLSKFPSVEQDMTLKVDTKLPFGELDEAIAEVVFKKVDVHKTVVGRKVLDIYQPKNSSHKNVTYRFSVTSYERTLTAGEVNKLLDDIAANVNNKIRANRV